MDAIREEAYGKDIPTRIRRIPMLTLQEQSILQELARAYAACAAQPKHAEKRELF